MFATVSLAARRMVAWPVVIVGATIVHFGGMLIVAGAWLIDIDVKELL
jgi:hypothetical protein